MVKFAGRTMVRIPDNPQKAFAAMETTLESKTTSPVHLIAGAGDGR